MKLLKMSEKTSTMPGDNPVLISIAIFVGLWLLLFLGGAACLNYVGAHDAFTGVWSGISLMYSATTTARKFEFITGDKISSSSSLLGFMATILLLTGAALVIKGGLILKDIYILGSDAPAEGIIVTLYLLVGVGSITVALLQLTHSRAVSKKDSVNRGAVREKR